MDIEPGTFVDSAAFEDNNALCDSPIPLDTTTNKGFSRLKGFSSTQRDEEVNFKLYFVY